MNGNKQYVKSKYAQKILGISGQTLRRWSDNNLIETILTPGGQRLYYIGSMEHNGYGTGSTKEKLCYCYCRVSTSGQRNDLQRQVDYMAKRFPNHIIITDIASGINWKRKGLQTILDQCFKGNVAEIVVAYKDRLCRFGFELLEWIFQKHDVSLMVLNQTAHDPETELSQDLIAIIHVFSCRANGRRKYKKEKEEEGVQKEKESILQNSQVPDTR